METPFRHCAAPLVAIGLSVCAVPASRAASESVLHAFTGGNDGAFPYEGLLRDRTGAILGTTGQGGAHDAGTVFELAPDGTEQIIHSFRRTSNQADEINLDGRLGVKQNELFGATARGGSAGLGTVFDIARDGHFGVRYRFTGAPDGAFPAPGLTAGHDGVVYGVTMQGGTFGNSGTLFRVTRAGQETVLHSFGGSGDGSAPTGTVLQDGAGNLYGVTSGGFGTVFRVAPDGSEKVLYAFQGGNDGAYPNAPLAVDKRGNVYGTAYSGGVNGQGVIFRISPAGAETVMHAFAGGPSDGGFPSGGVVIDGKGNLYGSTLAGGASNSGTVYETTLGGAETILHAFSGADGYFPVAGLVRDQTGKLYGVTELGGLYGQGVVFQVTP